MKKIITVVLVANMFCSQAQTLFTYGKKAVTKQEFLAAFNKNPSVNADKKKALEEYKNLYINFKLKVQSAYDDKLQEQASFITESDNFKKQIAENAINDEADAKILLKEAFDRSQRDIDLSQIFIANNEDTAKARNEIFKAFNELKSGKKFEDVFSRYCNDEGVKKGNGNIGFITVFTLPYQIENVVYALKQGQFSAPFKSAYGWHIFKNMVDRPAAGKRRMAQILISYPPNATPEERTKAETKAKDLYAKAVRGENFGYLAQENSNDYSTASNKGDMGEVGLGKYNKDFEKQIFDLHNVGDISPLFYGDDGIHILKLVEIIPVAKSLDDANYAAILKQKLDNSDRLAIAKKNLLNKWKTITGFKKAFFNEQNVMAFADSVIQEKSTDALMAFVNDSTILYSFKKQNIHAADFVQYVRDVKYAAGEGNGASTETTFKTYEEVCVGNYYRNHIDEYNKSLQAQLKEFNEANLLFAGMDKNVWSKASQDTVGLQNFYHNNKAKYNWKPGIAAVTINANSKTTAVDVYNKLREQPQNWRSIIAEEGTKVVADSGRYENDQLPVKTSLVKQVGYLSEPERSGSDESYSFIYVTKVFETTEPRSFDEAKGLVMNDYQQELEQKWLTDLKKKYPVKFNNAVWMGIK